MEDFNVISANKGRNIFRGFIENIEKAYQVGDTKDYNGRTYYVHGLNAKGQPLWRLKEKKKKGSDNSNSVLKPDPRDKNAQQAGFLNYKEMENHQSYVTCQRLIEKLEKHSRKGDKTLAAIWALKDELKKLEPIEKKYQDRINNKLKPDTDNISNKPVQSSAKKPIVPDAYIQYGNRKTKEIKEMYNWFNDNYKDLTADQLKHTYEKVSKNASRDRDMWKTMKANGESKVALNKQGNIVDELMANAYTAKRLYDIKSKEEKKE